MAKKTITSELAENEYFLNIGSYGPSQYVYVDSDGERFSTDHHGDIKQDRKERDEFLARKKEYKEAYDKAWELYWKLKDECRNLKPGEIIYTKTDGFSPGAPDSYHKYKKIPGNMYYVAYRIHGDWFASTLYGDTLEDCFDQIRSNIANPGHVGDPNIDIFDFSSAREIK